MAWALVQWGVGNIYVTVITYIIQSIQVTLKNLLILPKHILDDDKKGKTMMLHSLTFYAAALMIVACTPTEQVSQRTNVDEIDAAEDLSIDKVISPNQSEAWEVSEGLFAGMRFAFESGTFTEDISVKAQLPNRESDYLIVSINPKPKIPVSFDLPAKFHGLKLADTEKLRVSHLDESGRTTSLRPDQTMLKQGVVRIQLHASGVLSMTDGEETKASTNSSANTDELKTQIEALLKNSSATFAITAPTTLLATSSTNVVWQAATGALTYKLVIASDSLCATATQTFDALTSPQRSLTGLTSGVSYLCAYAIGQDAVAKPALNNGLELRVDVDPPAKPATPTDDGVRRNVNNATFIWTAATDTGPAGIQSYELEVGTTSGGNNIFAANVALAVNRTITALADGNYFARYRAIDAAGNASPWSDPSDGLLIDTVINAVPSSLITAADSAGGADVRYDDDTTIYLAWTSATDTGSGIASYTVRRFDLASCSGSSTDQTGIVTTNTSYTGTTGTTYSFRVIAIDQAGNTGTSACSGNITIDTSAPAALDGFTATTSSSPDGNISVALDFPASTTDYASVRIIRKAGATAPTDCNDGTVILNTTSYTDRTIADATGAPASYFSYRACVYDQAGNITSSNTSANVQARTRSHKLFVTSGAWNGHLLGLTGADAYCQAAAVSAGIQGSFNWKALMSVAGTSAASRVAIKGPIYRADGTTLLATDSVDFWDGTILAAVRTEVGAVGTAAVWTGSNSGGGIASSRCSDWYTAVGHVSGFTATSDTTTFMNPTLDAACSNTASLYCLSDYVIPALTSFTAAPGSGTDINVTIDFPADSSLYGKVEIRRIIGGIAPNANCTSDGTIIKTYTSYVDETFSDPSLTAGMKYSYRACVYDEEDALVSAAGLAAVNAQVAGEYHTIFTTSTSTNGNFGGLAGADAICNTRAAAAGLGGQWVALLSSTSIDANQRLYIDGPFFNTIHGLVANNMTDLWDGTIATNIGYDEFGGSNTNYRWTGSTAGGAYDNICGTDWNSDSGGDDGMVSSNGTPTNSEWFRRSGGSGNCANLHALTCVSHESTPDLTAFSAATGTVTDGDITLTVTYPGDTSSYGRIDFRRSSGPTAPNKSCSSGTLAGSITNFATTTFTDPTGSAGAVHSYRACLYDDNNRLVSSAKTATAVYARGKNHTVFYTSTEYTGNLGGRSGADAKCASAATAAGLVGTYKALIATSTVHMRDSVPFTGPIYTVLGETIASGSTDFYDGTLAVGIRDEFGAYIYNRRIWNNTTSGGTRDNGSQLCLDWTSSSSGQNGTRHEPTAINATALNCDATSSILCAEE